VTFFSSFAELQAASLAESLICNTVKYKMLPEDLTWDCCYACCSLGPTGSNWAAHNCYCLFKQTWQLKEDQTIYRHVKKIKQWHCLLHIIRGLFRK
jgi:hypothetical protein